VRAVPDARDEPLDRRPIASRELAPSRWMAQRLARLGVSANAISVAGLVAGVGAGAGLAATSAAIGSERVLWLAGAALVQLRLLANMLDGMVALASGRTTKLGELYNEIPDRLSDVAVLVGLGYASGGNATLGYAAALSGVSTAYVRAAARNAGAPMDFCGPFAKPQRMFLVTLAALYLGLAPRAWRPEWNGRPFGVDGELGLPALALAIVAAGSVLTSLRRLVRAARALEGAR
jgi:phosphatidylglycerophosphate synthase